MRSFINILQITLCWSVVNSCVHTANPDKVALTTTTNLEVNYMPEDISDTQKRVMHNIVKCKIEYGSAEFEFIYGKGTVRLEYFSQRTFDVGVLSIDFSERVLDLVARIFQLENKLVPADPIIKVGAPVEEEKRGIKTSDETAFKISGETYTEKFSETLVLSEFRDDHYLIYSNDFKELLMYLYNAEKQYELNKRRSISIFQDAEIAPIEFVEEYYSPFRGKFFRRN